MSLDRWESLLAAATAIPGVRGALLVSVDDGLVVAETAMESLATEDVAALGAAVIARALRFASAAGSAAPRSVRLSGEHGTLMAFAADPSLWMLAVTEPDAELGRLRLVLGDLAAAVT